MAKNPISNYEIGIIKVLISLKYENQDILAYINRYREANKLKHINSGRISDIKSGKIGKDIPLALDKEINQKLVAYIQIFESNDKPLINNNGDIYYRYNAETRKIAKLDLLRIINERKEKELHLTMQKHIENIFKNGIENSAILNVITGEVEGKGGNVLISQDLLPKIAFIKEGHFVEKGGAPALVLKGNVESISTDGIVVTHDVLKSIDDKYIYEVFFLQNINKQDAITCLETMAKFQASLLPMRYFAKKAEMDKDGLVQFLESIARDTTKKILLIRK